MKSSSTIRLQFLSQIRSALQSQIHKRLVLSTAVVLFAVLLSGFVATPAQAQAVPSGCVMQGVSVETVASQQECDALMVLYTTTDGPNWTTSNGWNTATDPCDWAGVLCSEDGVSELELIGAGLTGSIPPEVGDFDRLEALYLSSNRLSGTIPPELGALSSLRTLNLWTNELSGPIPPELGAMSSLQSLNLGGNDLSGPIPRELADMPSLRSLTVTDNDLTGQIPSEFGTMGTLSGLHLGGNQLSGPIPASLGSAVNLYQLDLADNKLTGSLPAELANLERLWSLDVSGNQLTGDVTAVVEGVLDTTYLLTLENSVDGNDCLTSSSEAATSFLELKNPGWDICSTDGCVVAGVTVATILSQQECFALVKLYNDTDGPNWNWWTSGGWNTTTSPCEWAGVTCNQDGVTELRLYGAGLNGIMPAELGKLSELTKLEIEANDLYGQIPAEFENLTNLSSLRLTGNRITGPIPAELGNLNNLTTLDLGFNAFREEIPAELANLSNLSRLSLQFNGLSGEIPIELGGMDTLTTLHLNANWLEGPIPVELANLGNLSSLDLSSNRLSGEIPGALGRLGSLTFLGLASNQLSGEIPAELGNLSNLEHLQLDNNQLIGAIPDEIGGLSQLTDLRLSANRLSGDMTGAIEGTLDTLTVLWLTDSSGGNDCFTTSSFAVYTFLNAQAPSWGSCAAPVSSSCVLQGVSVGTVASQQECDALDALYAATQGASWIDSDGWNTATNPCGWFGVKCNYRGVREVHLDHNNLSGSIPGELGGLRHLNTLWLGANLLEGSIPGELGNLDELRYLALAGNRLSGDLTDAIAGISDTVDDVVVGGDGLGGNDCLTSESTAVTLFLDESNPRWNECEAEGCTIEFAVVQTAATQEECDVLLALVLSIRGDMPTGWGTYSDPCGWFGVTCNDDGVTELRLADNGLIGTLPDELAGLNQLVTLDLSSSQLSGDVGELIGGSLATLTTVRLNGNGCLTSSSETVSAFLDDADPGWDWCQSAHEVLFSNTCLAGNGRVDVNVVNSSDRSAVYTYQVGSLSPRTFTVEAGDWGRSSVTGRSDGQLLVSVWANGQALATETVTVVCSTPVVTAPEVQVMVSCRDGNGFVTWLFANRSNERRSWIMQFDGVRNRSTSAAPFGGAVRGVSGRPDGEYDYTVLRGVSPIAQGTVTIDCD